MGSTSSIFAPVTFTGVSKYSTDFQSVLTRANAIAQLPVTTLTNKNIDIASRDTSLTALNAAVASIGTALTNIGKLGTGLGLTATTTDATAVTATITGATTPVSYSITNITSIASAASERTSTGYPNGNSAQVSSTGTLKLVVNGYSPAIPTFTLAAGKNNLAGLRDAINGLNAGVTATVLTAGSGATSTYLSISANSPGANTLQLIDDPGGAATNLLSSANQGTDSVFQLNGIPVDRPTAVINDVIPGLTLNILGKTAANETAGVNVTTDTSKIGSALNNLVTAYNTAFDQVNAQIGPAAGLLSGNSVIYQIRQGLSQIVHYNAGGTTGNLANLGIEVGQNGHLSFNQTTFASLSESQIAASSSLLGSPTTGLGALQTTFHSISDPISGSITQQLAADKVATARLTSQIATLNARILAQETTLNAQLEKADAAVASLASQQNLLTSSIASLNFTSFGYQSQTSATG